MNSLTSRAPALVSLFAAVVAGAAPTESGQTSLDAIRHSETTRGYRLNLGRNYVLLSRIDERRI